MADDERKDPESTNPKAEPDPILPGRLEHQATDPPRDLEGEVFYLSRRVADLEQKRDRAEREPLPPFLRESIRHREAYLTLHKDLSRILGNDWHDIPSDEIKRRINVAMADSLEVWI